MSTRSNSPTLPPLDADAAAILDTMPKLAYPLPEAAELVGLAVPTLYRHAKLGALRMTKLGSRTVIINRDLAEFLATARRRGDGLGKNPVPTRRRIAKRIAVKAERATAAD